jgi:hypothetical protein
MLSLLLYASRDEADRIKLVFDPSEIEIIYPTQKVCEPRDLMSLGDLRDIDVAIVDATETGAKQVCNYLARVRRMGVALLVNGGYEEWAEWTHYPVLAYIPKAAGDKELAARIRSFLCRTCSSSDITDRINSN